MRGAGRTGARALPSPRAVSRMLQGAEKRPPLPHVTLMVMQWGQFLDHDIVHTPESAGKWPVSSDVCKRVCVILVCLFL